MKKLFSSIILLMLLTACTTTSNQQTTELEEISTAIREVSNYLNNNVEQGSMSAFLNIESQFEELSALILDELTTNAVNDRVFRVVDRQRLDLIREEQGFQFSGEVDDESALNIGRFLGAQTIITGRVSSLGDNIRLTIRALNVETAEVMGQVIKNIGSAKSLTTLIGGGSRQSTQTRTQQPSRTTVQVPGQHAPQPTPQAPAQPTIPVVNVEGASLAERLQWIEANAANNTLYHIELSSNESLTTQTLSFSRARNVTVRLSGGGTESFISLTGNGSLFTIESGVTLILENGVTLEGHNRNRAPLVMVNARGTLIMNDGAKIVGNHNYSGGLGGGVAVDGAFTMNGGEISSNATNIGGGVVVGSVGFFSKTGGTIYGSDGGSNANRATASIVPSSAVYIDYYRSRDSTAGPSVRIDSSVSGAAGGWDR